MRSRMSLGALAAAVGMALSPSATEGAIAAVPKPTVLLRWGSTQGGSQVITEAQAVANARNYDLLVGRINTYAPYLTKMRAANPDLKLISYVNGVYSVPGNQNLFPESWHLHDHLGRPIMSIEDDNYLMNPLRTGWIADRTNECADDLAESGWDGCYLDMLGGATLHKGYTTEVPVDPRTGRTWTVVDWIADTSRIGASVKAGNPDKMIVVNGLSNGTVYFDPAQGPASTLLRGTDGGNAQGWLRGETTPVDGFRPENKWRQDVRLVVDAGNRGKSAMTMTKMAVSSQTPAQVDRWHRYTVASFLLGTDGHQYMFFTTDRHGSVIAPDRPADHVNPGTPTGPMRVVTGGAYVRGFSAGMAMVNPTLAAVKIVLPRAMTNLSGNTVTRVTLAPNTGDVLTF